MPSRASENLLGEQRQQATILEKGTSEDQRIPLEEDEPVVQCDCKEYEYGVGDAVFSSLVVAPLVVGVWRGTWGIMDLHSELFPYAQSFIMGIIVHVCFALIRAHLLTRSQGAWSDLESGGAGRWLRERFLSRIYLYVFILANITHWRGGWGLLDATVSAIVPDGDPHVPVLYAVFTIIFYLVAACFRSSRNFLASPYFLVTDGKEATYIFTTRFKKDLESQVELIKKEDHKGTQADPSGYQRVAGGPVGRDVTAAPAADAGRSDNAITCVISPRATLALAMRGSTAGLADTLASGSRAHAALLELADALFASTVVAPAVVTYWKSTWTLMDLLVLPSDPVASAASCATFGLGVSLVFCVFQSQLSKYLNPDRGRLTYYVFSRLYTCVAAVACVGAWRGVWNLLNECTGSGAKLILSTTGAAGLSLAALRSLRNVCAAPFAVAVDTPQDYFDVPTMFRTSSRETALYVLDCVFSVTVVGSLVVFVWRGSWALLDLFLWPEDQLRSCTSSLIIGYALVILTFGLQAPIRWAAARLHGAPRLFLADVYHLLAFFATVNVWRGVWGLLDIYLFPDSPKLSNWCSHIISLCLLILLNCSNTILVRGVYIDAEEPAGECVVFPCHYLRLFFHRERTKKRHKRALQAAAVATARKSEDANLPLQMPPLEEKV